MVLCHCHRNGSQKVPTISQGRVGTSLSNDWSGFLCYHVHILVCRAYMIIHCISVRGIDTLESTAARSCTWIISNQCNVHCFCLILVYSAVWGTIWQQDVYRYIPSGSWFYIRKHVEWLWRESVSIARCLQAEVLSQTRPEWRDSANLHWSSTTQREQWRRQDLV